MKKKNKTINDEVKKKIDNSNKNKIREELTVSIIQQNKLLDKLMTSMNETLVAIHNNSESFKSQRELFAKNKMMERVIYASLKMLEQNKLKLWMIDERSIEE